MQAHLLGLLAGKLGDSGHGLAVLLAFGYLFEHHLGGVGMLVQIVVEFLLYEVADELVDGNRAVGRNLLAAELCLRLALEDRLLDSHADGGHHAVAYVGKFVTLSREFLLLYGSHTHGKP